MSVLIKNMHMPMDCQVCPLFSVHESCCTISNYKFVAYTSERPKWCPLVDIPQHIEKKIDKEIDEYNAPLDITWNTEKRGIE